MKLERSYLFFDIECANCFGGIGKMCSFGYALTDSAFNVLDSQDVVMNPEAEFDWYLFSPKNKCPLAYSKDYFRMQRNFEAYHRGIKKLMEESGRRIIGFSSANDVGFLVSAWERYSLAPINFSVYDSAAIASAITGEKHRLEQWCDHYALDTGGLTAHRSSDDAMMTMLLVKALCAQTGLDIESLLASHKGHKLSVEKYLEQREMKRQREETLKKIQNLYGKKNRAPLSEKLSGMNFVFSFKALKDGEEAYKLADLIYRNGGTLAKSLKSGSGILLVPPAENGAGGVKCMTKEDVYRLLGAEKALRANDAPNGK